MKDIAFIDFLYVYAPGKIQATSLEPFIFKFKSDNKVLNVFINDIAVEFSQDGGEIFVYVPSIIESVEDIKYTTRYKNDSSGIINFSFSGLQTAETKEIIMQEFYRQLMDPDSGGLLGMIQNMDTQEALLTVHSQVQECLKVLQIWQKTNAFDVTLKSAALLDASAAGQSNLNIMIALTFSDNTGLALMNSF